METTEKIVESYMRYVKKCATISNIKCPGQYEIDLLAIDLNIPEQRFHIETGISISGNFSKLTGNKFNGESLKKRGLQAPQRRTVGYFIERKFNVSEILETLSLYGFEKGKYKRVIVTWDATKAAIEHAKEHGVLIWFLPVMLNTLSTDLEKSGNYYTDDILRTIQLSPLARKNSQKSNEFLL